MDSRGAVVFSRSDSERARGADRLHRMMRRALVVVLVAYLGSGLLAAVRSLSPPRVAVAAGPPSASGLPTAVVTVDTPARVETWVDIGLVQDEGVREVASYVIPRRRFAYWNHRWKRETYRVELTARDVAELHGDAVTLRVAVQPGPVWTWRRPPVARDLVLPLRRPGPGVPTHRP